MAFPLATLVVDVGRRGRGRREEDSCQGQEEEVVGATGPRGHGLGHGETATFYNVRIPWTDFSHVSEFIVVDSTYALALHA